MVWVIELMPCIKFRPYMAGPDHTAVLVCATRFDNLDVATRLDCGARTPNHRPLEAELYHAFHYN
jgi:hypothetical protein